MGYGLVGALDRFGDSPRDYVRALVSGLPDLWRGRRRMVMLQAFIDDSGWDGNSPVFVLAGFVAKEKQWEDFSDAWQAVLDLEEPKKLPFLKTREAYLLNNHKSMFYGWTEKERDDRLEKMVRVINAHVEHAIISGVPIEPYRRLFAGKFNPESLDRPYFLSFFSIMTYLLKVAKEVHDDNIDFIFDTLGGESKALLVQEYERFKGLAPPELQKLAPVIPKFECEQKMRPLQAADMIAWLARRHFFDAARGRDVTSEPSNVFLANLYRPEHDMFDIWDEARIQDAAQTISRSNWAKSPLRAVISYPDPTSPLPWLSGVSFPKQSS